MTMTLLLLDLDVLVCYQQCNPWMLAKMIALILHWIDVYQLLPFQLQSKKYYSGISINLHIPQDHQAICTSIVTYHGSKFHRIHLPTQYLMLEGISTVLKIENM